MHVHITRALCLILVGWDISSYAPKTKSHDFNGPIRKFFQKKTSNCDHVPIATCLSQEQGATMLDKESS